IRELVDPEANIIWGSAFNPMLEGKIRVSVVATGIEQSAEQAHSASQPLSFGRAPKKPVLPLPTEEELAEDAVATTPSHEGMGDFTQQPRFADETAQPAQEDAYASLRTPPPSEPGDEGEEEGLSEPAADDEFGENGGGYASLSGTRIERDPEIAAEDAADWGEGEP